MKKIFNYLLILFILMGFVYITPIKAEEENFAYIPELEIRITMPEDYIFVTRDSRYTDELFESYGFDYEDTINYMHEENVYLMAYNKYNSNFEIELYAFPDNTFTDFNKVGLEDVDSVFYSWYSETYFDDVTIADQYFRKLGPITFLVSSFVDYNVPYYEYDYVTFLNGYRIHFSGVLYEDEERFSNDLYHMAKSITTKDLLLGNDVVEKENISASKPSTNSDEATFIAIGVVVVSVILLGFVYEKITRRNKNTSENNVDTIAASSVAPLSFEDEKVVINNSDSVYRTTLNKPKKLGFTWYYWVTLGWPLLQLLMLIGLLSDFSDSYEAINRVSALNGFIYCLLIYLSVVFSLLLLISSKWKNIITLDLVKLYFGVNLLLSGFSQMIISYFTGSDYYYILVVQLITMFIAYVINIFINCRYFAKRFRPNSCSYMTCFKETLIDGGIFCLIFVLMSLIITL